MALGQFVCHCVVLLGSDARYINLRLAGFVDASTKLFHLPITRESSERREGKSKVKKFMQSRSCIVSGRCRNPKAHKHGRRDKRVNGATNLFLAFTAAYARLWSRRAKRGGKAIEKPKVKLSMQAKKANERKFH
jgi:hypothetical protein